MYILILTFVFLIVLFLIIAYFNRNKEDTGQESINSADNECCGAHEVCEKESLLNNNIDIVYYDDEELDSLSNIDSKNYTEKQLDMLSDVFYTLKEADVAGWLRSLQLRNIELPQEIKDAALLIIRERRGL